MSTVQAQVMPMQAAPVQVAQPIQPTFNNMPVQQGQQLPVAVPVQAQRVI
jgi:hypothetical protein